MWVAGGGVLAEALCGHLPVGSSGRVGGGPGWEGLPSREPGSLIAQRLLLRRYLTSPGKLKVGGHPSLPGLGRPHKVLVT